MTGSTHHIKQSPDTKRRNSKSHQAILESTVLLLERDGYKALTIEGIAAHAGVGKQTIYRWWSSKAELVLEASMAAGDARIPEPDTGSIVTDIQAILLPIFKLNETFRKGNALANKTLMAEAQLDPEFLKTYAQLHLHWRKPLRSVFERAKAQAELDQHADVEALIDALLGATWYRLLLEHAPLDKDFADSLIKIVLEGTHVR
ncbi:MAG: TetR/AcrR family transcriptional regulator [Chloroflexota bacterium]